MKKLILDEMMFPRGGPLPMTTLLLHEMMPPRGGHFNDDNVAA
jgi:hypothetical protein